MYIFISHVDINKFKMKLTPVPATNNLQKIAIKPTPAGGKKRVSQRIIFTFHDEMSTLKYNKSYRKVLF
jgi:hypothetical protein